MARNGARSLAGGAVIETRLCARLLGVKLLVVDGAITVWPAQLEQPVLDVTPARWTEVEPAGGRLEATARRLDGTAHRLQQLRPGRVPRAGAA
jgi:hypothetical protein